MGIFKQMLFLIKHAISDHLGTIAISFLLCVLLSENISDYIFSSHVKYQEITISTYELDTPGKNEVKLIDNYYSDKVDSSGALHKKYGFYNILQMKAAITDLNNVTFVDADSSEYGLGYIIFNELDAFVKINIPQYPNTCLSFVVDSNQYGLDIRNKDGSFVRYIGDYENSIEGLNILKVYPFSIDDYIYIYGIY